MGRLGIRGAVLITFVLVVGSLSPALETALNIAQTAKAQADTSAELNTFLAPYKANLRSLGDYFTGHTIEQREAIIKDVGSSEEDKKNLKTNIEVPPVTGTAPKLKFELRKTGGIQIYALHDDPETEEDDSYVTNIFFSFDLVEPTKDIKLVLDPNGFGALYTKNTDPIEGSPIYGDPKKCIIPGPEDKPEEAKLDYKNCPVSVSAVVGNVMDGEITPEAEARWQKFASYVIPPKMRPTSCPIPSGSAQNTPPADGNNIDTAQAAAPLVIALWAGVRWCAVRLVQVAATRWGQAAIVGLLAYSFGVLDITGAALLAVFTLFFPALGIIALIYLGAVKYLGKYICGSANDIVNNEEQKKRGIAGIFLNLAGCIYEGLIRPVIVWASKLVIQAAGISALPRYLRPEQNSYVQLS